MSDAARVARGTWYGLWAQAVDKILPVAILLYLARTLAPDQFGVYSFVIAYLALFQTAAEYSLDTVLLRILSSRTVEERVRAFQAGLTLKLIVAVTCAVVATMLAGWVSGSRAPVGLMALASLSLVTTMGGAYRAFYRAALDIRLVFYVAGLRAVFLGGAVLVAVTVAPGLYSIFLAMAVANALAFTAVASTFGRTAMPRLRYDGELWGLLLRGAAPLALNAFALTVSLRAGQILLMSMRGPVEVGLLGAASRVTEAFVLLPEALMISVYPLMARLYVEDEQRALRVAERSSRYLVTAVGALALLCLSAGEEIMTVLYGASFAGAGSVLGLLAAASVISAFGTVILNLLVAAHREVAVSRVAVTFAAVNVALSIPMIARFGYPGAAVALVLSSAASQIVLALLPSTSPYARPCLISALRPLAAVAVAAVTAVTLRQGEAASTIAVVSWTAAVYAVGLLAFRVAGREDLAFFRALLSQRSR